jgi:hypothetical protein
MLKFLLVALVLTGSVSNCYGRIGIKISHEGGIGKVYRISPAARAGLQRGDIVRETDGVKGSKHIAGEGLAGIPVRLKIFRRGIGEFYVTVPRVAREEVSD